MLSRRLIIFTSTQLFFSCTIGTRAEDTIYSIPNEITGHWSDDKHMLYHWTMPGDPLADS